MHKSRIGLLKNISSMGIVQIANYVFPLITIPIISRIIGPDKFGTINFAASFVAYFTLLIGFGFDLTATRKVASDPLNEQNRNKVFSEVFITQCMLLILSVIIFLICLFNIPQLREEKTVAIYSFIVCLSTVFTQNWLFQAMQDLSKVAILSLLSKILFSVMVLTLVKTKADYIWQPLALSLSMLVIAIASFAWSIKRYHLKLHAVKFIDCCKLIWDEKIFFFSLCLINLYTNTNIVILGILQNSRQVGYYTSGQKLISIIQSIIAYPLSQAFYPYIGKAFAESYERGINVAQKLFQFVFLLTFSGGIAIIIAAPVFIKLFYGNLYLPAITVCRILAFVPMCIGLNTILGIHVMMNLKLDKLFFKVISLSAFISIVLTFLLVKKFGYIGSAYTWATIEFINFFGFVIILKRNGINLLNRSLFSPARFIQNIIFLRGKENLK